MNTRRISSLVLAAAGLLSLSAVDVEAAGPAGAWKPEVVHSHALLGTPTQVEGRFLSRAVGGDAAGAAREFLGAIVPLTGLRNPDQELRIDSVSAVDEVGMQHVRFSHWHQGVRVFGSELIVHLRGRVVLGLTGTFLPSLSERVRVTVEADDAVGLALEHFRDLLLLGDVSDGVMNRSGELDLDGNPELVFFQPGLISGEPSSLHLAWQFSLNGYQYFVSAATGRVLEHFDLIHGGLSRTIYDAEGTTNVTKTLVCSEGSGCKSTKEDDDDLAYEQFGLVHAYFQGTHSRDSYDGKGGKLVGTVHYSQNFVNAYWDGKQMVFGDNMVVDDVTAHELGHGVCQYTANLTYKNQSGALNESFSDVWGVMVDRDDWLMGEDLDIGAIRSMSDPGAYNQPKDMTEYKNYKFYDNGGVHINSGIPNYAAYLLSDGGTNQGVVVKAQGRGVVEKIWYRAESTKLTSSSDFKAFANAAISACAELYGGKTATQCKETENAMKAVKIL